MVYNMAERTLPILISRLKVLAGLLERAEAEAGEKNIDLADIMEARLAPDMLPFPWQIVFACKQPRRLSAWMRGIEMAASNDVPNDWALLKDHISESIAEVEAVRGLPLPIEDQHIDLGPMGKKLVLDPQRYVEDWILPNFYFHITTTYALLRMKGIGLGKLDFLAHAADAMVPNDAESSA